MFKNEVQASISFDWVAPDRKKIANAHELIGKGIDRFIQEDEIDLALQSGQHQHHLHPHHKRNHKRDLTKEAAIEM